jgi:hypothetical protein
MESMNTAVTRSAGLSLALVASGMLVGCVPTPPDNDDTADPSFKQYQLDTVEYGSKYRDSDFPFATLSDDGKVLSVRQLGSPGCEVEPSSFEQQEDGGTLRVTYEFVKPNPDGVCNTALAFFGTDLSFEEAQSGTLEHVVLVDPFGHEEKVSVGSA